MSKFSFWGLVLSLQKTDATDYRSNYKCQLSTQILLLRRKLSASFVEYERISQKEVKKRRVEPNRNISSSVALGCSSDELIAIFYSSLAFVGSCTVPSLGQQ
jgi:hypothetical protein